MLACFSRARPNISALSIYYGACAFNFNCTKSNIYFGKDRQLTLCCAVYSRAHSITLRPGQSARSIRGRELNKGAE